MKFIKRLVNKIVNIAKATTSDEVGVFSAQSSFFITLSIFPFLIMIYTIIMILPSGRNTIIDIINNLLPPILHSFTKEVIGDLGNTASGVAISISSITAIWSASRGILSIMNGLYKINSIKNKRNYFINRLISMVYTLAFALAIIGTVILIVFGNKIVRYILSLLPKMKGSPYLSMLFRYLITFLLLFLFFELVYRMSNRKNTTFYRCIPGSAVSAIGWVLFSFGFSIYVDKFSNYSAVYGAFTAIIVLMLWIYFCMYIMFIGAETNKAFDNYLHKRQEIKKNKKIKE